MDRYRENSSKVIQLLQEYGYHRASVDQARYCYRDLEKELISQGRHYSPPFAEEWCRNLEQKHSNYRVRSYRNALRFLAEMYETGVVRNRKPGTACHRLAEPFQKHLIAFLKESEETYSSDSLRRFRNDCSCFLLYAQNHGAASVSEISYDLMHGFYIDEEKKVIRFDVVLSFGVSQDECIKTICDEVAPLYPDYNLVIVPDIDITD